MPDSFGRTREPSIDEAVWFQSNPHIAGYADFDTGTVLLNPFSHLSQKELNFVRQNEQARLVMQKYRLKPSFNLTPEQQKAFGDYGDLEHQRQTIAARILSGDPSALKSTKEQQQFVSDLRKVIADLRKRKALSE